MKQSWEIKKLGEVCSITMGQSPSSDTYNDSEGLPFFQGNADFGKIHPSIRVYCNAPIRIADVDDILISVRAPIGAINIANCKCCIGRGLASIRNNAEVANEYIYHALIANKEKLIAQGTGSTFKSIGKEALKELSIPVPPREEQERIVAELDCLSGVIEKKREQLRELDALAQSIFYQMFGDPITNEKGWEVKKLEEVCHKIGDGLHGTPKYDEDGGVAFINGNNLIDGKIVITDRTLFVNDIEAQKYRIDMDANTILLSINGTLGRTAIFRNENVILGKSACYCNINNTFLITKFVEHLMNSISFKGFLEDNSSKSTIRNVGLKAIRGYGIILPPLTLQQEFADKIEAIDIQKRLIKESIAKTEELFNSIMAYYFN